MSNSPDSAPAGRTGSPAKQHYLLHLRRRVAHLARWLHTYLSMLSFSILLFFAVTGFTLNHAEWVESQQRPRTYQGSLNVEWVKASDPSAIATQEISAYFRQTHHIRGALSDVHIQGDQCEVVFKGPGYEADATIDRGNGTYQLSVVPGNLMAVLNDLHKGRDTGKSWSRVIDFSAILMTLVSLTGLTLIFFLNKRRMPGLLLIALGALLCCAIYFMWVS